MLSIVYGWLFLPLLSSGMAKLVNKTIDDQYGDQDTGFLPSYIPVNGWSQGASCTDCLAKPDPSQAFDHTWTDTSRFPGDDSPRSVSVSFNGTAVYAYCIIANTVPSTSTLTNLTFALDGEAVGAYEHIPDSSTSYQYNVPVYTNTSILNGQHTLAIQVTGDTNSTLVLFDYVTYTTSLESDSTTSSSPGTSPSLPSQQPSPSTSPLAASTSNLTRHVSAGAVAGGVIGGIVLLTLIAVAVYLLIRRKRRNVQTLDIDPHMQQFDPPVVFPFPGNHSSPSYSFSTPYPSTYNPYQQTSVVTPFLSETHRDNSNASESDLRQPPSTESLSKVAIARQEEISRQVREMEQIVAELQARRTNTVHVDSEQATGDGELLRQIEELKEEVERLKSQQQQMAWELHEVPPPIYERDGSQ